MDDAKCAETNEKSIFRFLFFQLLWKFQWKFGDLSTKVTITFLAMFNYMKKKKFYIFIFKCSNLQERCGMCRNEWKIHFPILSFWVMVDFVLKILRKLADFEYNIDHISKSKSRKNWFFIRFSTFRIFHVNMKTLFSWSVLNRIQVDTKKKYYMGLFWWTQSWYILARIEERIHTKNFINSSQSLCF